MRPVLVDINQAVDAAAAGRGLGVPAARAAAGRAAADQPDHRPGRRRADLRRRRRRQPRPATCWSRSRWRPRSRSSSRCCSRSRSCARSPTSSGRPRRFAEGDYDVSVPVTTGDELGELAASFNQMVAGLARARADPRGVRHLPRQGGRRVHPQRGLHRGGGRGRGLGPLLRRPRLHRASPRGDGREGGRRRAQRAVRGRRADRRPPRRPRRQVRGRRAARGLRRARRTTRTTPTARSRAALRDGAGRSTTRTRPGALRIGVGVNTGRVVAGAIGGAGRLNFSVIGDPVNVAARVEAATRNARRRRADHRSRTRDKLDGGVRAEDAGPPRLAGSRSGSSCSPRGRPSPKGRSRRGRQRGRDAESVAARLAAMRADGRSAPGAPPGRAPPRLLGERGLRGRSDGPSPTARAGSADRRRTPRGRRRPRRSPPSCPCLRRRGPRPRRRGRGPGRRARSRRPRPRSALDRGGVVGAPPRAAACESCACGPLPGLKNGISPHSGTRREIIRRCRRESRRAGGRSAKAARMKPGVPKIETRSVCEAMPERLAKRSSR